MRWWLLLADYAKAAPLFERSCAANEPIGCDALGELYRTGNGVAKDTARAEQLFDGACRAKNAIACKHLEKLKAAQASSSGAPH